MEFSKKRPFSPLSEPIEPIVYWIENTVPEEFRDAIREGIEAWNIAFEAIGFKNAIVAKQMPDDATWDLQILDIILLDGLYNQVQDMQ